MMQLKLDAAKSINIFLKINGSYEKLSLSTAPESGEMLKL